jgi:riboflavin kinase/FMN adenylyltransferase
MMGDIVTEEGIFYKGTKHGRWMTYNVQDLVQNKSKYYKGWPKESYVTYYDPTERKHLKEVVPVEYDEKNGYYYMLFESGTVAVVGEYKWNVKIGDWIENYPNGKRKRIISYSKEPFDKDFSRQTAVEFVRDILVTKIGMKTLVIGYDHHFGRNREGSFRDLEEMSPIFGFRLEEIPKQVINEIAVSSTKIRNSLLTGDIKTANNLLGYDFILSGKVVDGDKIGRTLGFPTANLAIAEQYKLIPGTGIYAVHVKVDSNHYKGMLYIGYRPIVQGKRLSVEVNIFDFNENIYNHDVTVYIKDRVRDDIHFSNMDDLRKKMKEDKAVATKMLE